MGMGYVVGLEVEWYLMRVTEEQLGDEHIGAPGVRGRPLKCVAPEPGFSYHSESQHGFDAARAERACEAYEKSDCRCVPSRTSGARGRWSARSRRVMRSLRPTICSCFVLRRGKSAVGWGTVATFMCRPALKGCYSSGWHLHQSVIKTNNTSWAGASLFMPSSAGGRAVTHGASIHGRPAQARRALLGLHHADRPMAIAAFQPNSLAPDRATWCYDHRGVMIRALGGPGDPATRLENRIGEPAANPYLYDVATRGGSRWCRTGVGPGTAE